MSASFDESLFDAEFHAIVDKKPPISATRIKNLASLALANAKHFKLVVHKVERFIAKCNPVHKISGLFVIDGIVKTARAKLGSKEGYVDRFAINLRTTVRQVLDGIGDSERDRDSLRKVVTLWYKQGIFDPALLQDLADMAGTTLNGDTASASPDVSAAAASIVQPPSFNHQSPTQQPQQHQQLLPPPMLLPPQSALYAPPAQQPPPQQQQQQQHQLMQELLAMQPSSLLLQLQQSLQQQQQQQLPPSHTSSTSAPFSAPFDPRLPSSSMIPPPPPPTFNYDDDDYESMQDKQRRRQEVGAALASGALSRRAQEERRVNVGPMDSRPFGAPPAYGYDELPAPGVTSLSTGSAPPMRDPRYDFPPQLPPPPLPSSSLQSHGYQSGLDMFMSDTTPVPNVFFDQRPPLAAPPPPLMSGSGGPPGGNGYGNFRNDGGGLVPGPGPGPGTGVGYDWGSNFNDAPRDRGRVGGGGGNGSAFGNNDDFGRGGPPNSGEPSGGLRARYDERGHNDRKTTTVFLGNLGDVNERGVREEASRFGEVVTINFLTGKKLCFVTFLTRQMAENLYNNAAVAFASRTPNTISVGWAPGRVDDNAAVARALAGRGMPTNDMTRGAAPPRRAPFGRGGFSRPRSPTRARSPSRPRSPYRSPPRTSPPRARSRSPQSRARSRSPPSAAVPPSGNVESEGDRLWREQVYGVGVAKAPGDAHATAPTTIATVASVETNATSATTTATATE